MTRGSTAWDRFWFAPEPTSTLALVRIAVGLLSLAWALSLLPDLLAFFSPGGVFHAQPAAQGPAVWGLLGIFNSDAAVVALYLVLVGASIALVLGFWSRIAAVLVFLALLSFARRAPSILNSGDGLIRNLALLLALAPSGAALSLDRWRRAKKQFWEFPARAPWALRLIQIQVSVLYLSTVWQKARGTTWNDGTAVSFAQRIHDLERFPLPSVLSHSLTLSNLQTFGTLAVELSLGVLVWNRVLRPYVLAVGVILHAGIDYSIRVGFFSFAIFASYVAFVPPETARAFILGLRDRARTRFRRVPGRTETSPGAGVAHSPAKEPG
jgi:hypothetical protein